MKLLLTEGDVFNLKCDLKKIFFGRIPGDLQKVVFRVAAQSTEDWETLLTVYHYATYDSEKKNMLRGLASTQDAQKIVW